MTASATSTTRVSYQEGLREAGAYLDAEHALSVSVIEVPDGLVVRYARSENESEMVTLTLSHDDMRAGARVRRDSARQVASIVHRDHSPGKYEDEFRALGYELDQSSPYLLVIDEVDDGLMVTYQYHNPIEGFLLRKHMAYLRAEECQDMVDRARLRRASHTIRSRFHLLPRQA